MRDVFDATLRIDPSDPLPRHAQVQRLLREMIQSGRLRPGDKIPAEADLAETMGVSRMTVNKALLALASGGYVVREIGRGTFVASSPSPSPKVRPARITLSFPTGAKNMLDSDYYGTIYRGVADRIEELATSDEPFAAELDISSLESVDYEDEARRSPSDGWIIVAPREDTIPSIERLYASGRPLVVVGASWPEMPVPSVDADNIDGAFRATDHLISEGHRRIALLYVEPETANTQDRIAGYRNALTAAGLPLDPAKEICAEKVWKAGDDARARIAVLTAPNRLGGDGPVTAIFAGGYYLALEAMNAVRETGLSVPEDVSVAGFDDPLSAHLVYPPLTTVRQPLYEMGRRAAARLVERIQGNLGDDSLHERLSAPLIVRRSTAPRKTSAS